MICELWKPKKYLQNIFLLITGNKCPQLAAQLINLYENITECIVEAIKKGYRHIDTAHIYYLQNCTTQRKSQSRIKGRFRRNWIILF